MAKEGKFIRTFKIDFFKKINLRVCVFVLKNVSCRLGRLRILYYYVFFRLGTTKKGIGPTYASKVLNIFIRFYKKNALIAVSV